MSFLLGLTGPLNERRSNLVLKAFKLMDKTGDGQVTIEDLSGVYDVSLNPDVVAGKVTEEEALRKFWMHLIAKTRMESLLRKNLRITIEISVHQLIATTTLN